MISANGVEYKNLPEQVQYLTEEVKKIWDNIIDPPDLSVYALITYVDEADAALNARISQINEEIEGLLTKNEAAATYDTISHVSTVETTANNALETATSALGIANTAAEDIITLKNNTVGSNGGLLKIKDNYGNLRFVEGRVEQLVSAGMTLLYGRWSLSGTHLMIVATFQFNSGTVLSSTTPLCAVSLPAYIANKISVIYGDIVARSPFQGFDQGGNMQSSNMSLHLNGNNLLIIPLSTTNFNSTKIMKIQFDLLIDAS